MPVATQAYLREHAWARLSERTRAWSDPQRERVLELLAATDTRRAVQGWAEVATMSLLEDAGWAVGLDMPSAAALRPHALAPGATIDTRIVTLAFTLGEPPPAEGHAAPIARLLEQVDSPWRLLVEVRRLVPGAIDLDTLAARTEAWLASGAATPLGHEDPTLELDIVRVGPRRPGQRVVVAIDGPWDVHRTLEALEPRLVHEALRHASGPVRQSPLVLSCVATPGWPMHAQRCSGAWLRDLLYGQANEVEATHGERRWTFDGTPASALFRDPSLRNVAAVMFLDRLDPVRARARVHVNPWATTPLSVGQLDLCADVFRQDTDVATGGDKRVLRWYETPSGAHEI